MKMLFILGCSRSGTTMLQQALNRHSRIVIPPETKFFSLFYSQPRCVQKRHLARINADLGIKLSLPRRNRRRDERGRECFEEMARQYVARLDREKVEYFGEKTPEHTSQIDVIRHLFPRAKFIFLYRDGRDVAISLTRVPWIRCAVYGGFAIWLHFYRFLKEAMADSSLDVLYVKYESLVRRPAAELVRICDFLGVLYEPAMATGYGNAEGIPDRERSWKGTALQPITPRYVERWRSELSPDQLQDLEWLGREQLTALGYPLATGGVRPASRLLRSRMALEWIRCARQLPWPLLWSELRRYFRRRALPSDTPREGRVPTAARVRGT